MISVGGVSLAILILVLALRPPEHSRLHLARLVAPASGALADRHSHPEWRQFLILAALRRADALDQLRLLPDAPVRSMPAPTDDTAPHDEPVPETIAGLPAAQPAVDPEDVTGSIGAAGDDAGIPVDIGEASSTELPVKPAEESPPVIKTPERETQHEGGMAPSQSR